ncbi:hypothetical protein HYW53_01045 [Candidatus Giovannonibacteria bacterium]|nr:hypothetical protein [Candidatus Giovannonibacteria bacterium]
MENLKIFFRNLIFNILISALVFIIAGLASRPVGDWFCKNFECGSGMWGFGLDAILGFFIALPFFLSLVFSFIGDQNKYIWIILILLLFFIFSRLFIITEVVVQLMIIPLLVGLVPGFLLSKVFPRFNLRTLLDK